MRINDRKSKAIAKKILAKRKIHCENKKRYTDPSMALAGAMTSVDHGCKDKLYYYKCDICNKTYPKLEATASIMTQANWSLCLEMICLQASMSLYGSTITS